MNELISYFDDLDILSYENLENYIWESKLQTLIDVAIQVRTIIDRTFIYKEYTPFSFVPSGELSGVGGCSEVNCKIGRARNFSIFSGLYADNVYLTLKFLTSIHFDTDIDDIYDHEYNFRYMLWCDFTIITTYADLINFGIVQIAPTQKNFCLDCFQKKLLDLPYPVDLSTLEQYYLNKAKLTLEEYDPKLNSVNVSFENMDEFFPLHTESVNFVGDILELLPKSERKSNTTIKNQKFKKAVVHEIVYDEFSEVCLYSLCCKNLDSKFITSKPSDGIFLEMTKPNKKYTQNISQIDNLPLYDLPIISDAPTSTILKLREIEGDSFNKYRIALNKAVQEHYNAENSVQVREIYDDIIYPAFQQLDERLHNLRSGMFKKTFSSIVMVGSVISAGVYTGIIPPNAPEILAAIGGASVVTSAGINVMNNLTNKKSTLRENDFYFLWKLKDSSSK